MVIVVISGTGHSLSMVNLRSRGLFRSRTVFLSLVLLFCINTVLGCCSHDKYLLWIQVDRDHQTIYQNLRRAAGIVFRNLNTFRTISMDYQKGNKLHSAALQSLLMNAADLSDQLKDWDSVKMTAAAVLTEFFKQGELEKSRGELPSITMDRDKCFIPDLEIYFMQSTCVPLFEIMGRIIPKAATCGKIIDNHIERWEAARPVFAEVPPTAGLAVLLSPELDNLIELNLKERERLRLKAEPALEENAE